MKMTSREKLLVLLLVVVLMGWLEFNYLMKPLFASYDLTKADLVTYTDKLTALKAAPGEIKKIETKLGENQNLIYGILEQHFTTTEQEEVILLMNDLAEGTDIRVSDISFSEPITMVLPGEDPAVPSETLYQVPITVNYEGSYDGLMAYMKKIWGFQKRLVVDTLDITGADDAATQTEGVAAAEVSGSVTLHLYYTRIPEGIQYSDNLYKWITDDTFFKGNPFKDSAGASDFRINYLFTGGKDIEAAAYVPFADIKGHWAEKEINDFGEKGYVKRGQNDKFGPDLSMTRGEFIIMLDGIYQWPVPEQAPDMTVFTDYDDLGSYENAIAKAVMKGLLGGYVVGFEDKTLRPRDPITYSDVEYLMQRLKNDESFKWDIVAEKLLAEKNVISAGVADKAAFVTRAEAVFLMTHFK